MPWDNPKMHLIEGLEEFARADFQEKRFTDLTIRCKDKEFHVHKLMLCLQSDFFANACKPDSPFKEAKTGIIELNDDDPADVRLLLDCFYCEHYDVEDNFWRHYHQDTPREEALRLRDIRLYAIADKYQCYDTKRYASKCFHRALDREPGYMKLSTASFINIAKKVFETTPESDRVLRNLVFRYAQKHLIVLMNASQFQPEMDEIEGFWSGLLRFQTFYAYRWRACPACARPEKNKLDDEKHISNGEMRMTCPTLTCRMASMVDDWNKPTDSFTGEAEMRSSLASGPPRKRIRQFYEDTSDEEDSPNVGNQILDEAEGVDFL